MKVYIIFDMEGCSGIYDWRQVTLSDPASSAARRRGPSRAGRIICRGVPVWTARHGRHPRGSSCPQLYAVSCPFLNQ